MILNELYQKLVSIPLKLLVKSKLLPEDPIKDLDIDIDSPIFYILQRRSTSSFLMLQEKAKLLNLPAPKIISNNAKTIETGAVFFLQRKSFFGFAGKPVAKYQKLLQDLLNTQKANIEKCHQLVPVSIYWGRNPGKEKSLLKIMFTDTESATFLRKFFLFLFQGRNSFVRISKPVNLQDVIKGKGSDKLILSKLTRTLRVHFHRHRRVAMGPLISNRRQVITNVIVSDNVRKVIEREARSKKITPAKAKKTAEKYAKEIASAYSYKTVRFMESALTHFWNKIYDGVVVNNAEMVRELATTHEIVYLPCHRSHIDYLLLSYTLYHEGLVPPHIAAGINLNFWPAGPILRRGGAFFLRRSFGGNKLYTAVFNEYIFQLMDRGIPLEFFPEGGRSRTGRLLPPKTGLLAMTVQSCLRGTRKPVAFVPVYVGYERMLEGKSYLNELRGADKKSESFGQLLGIRKTLKQAFGKVYLNFAPPLILNDYLDAVQPEWHQYRGEVNAKPSWLSPVIGDLADRLMERINGSVTLNSVSLVALVLLSTDRAAIDRKALENQLSLLLALSEKAPYSDNTQTPKEAPAELIAQAEKLGTIFTVANPMGDVVTTDEQSAILLTYYRNNILHVYITSALIASCFINQPSYTTESLKQELSKLFPFLKKELFLHWEQTAFEKNIDATIAVFVEQNMLINSDNLLTRVDDSHDGFEQLYTLAQIAKPTLLRYAIILTLLSAQSGKGNFTRQALENKSQQLAQRIAALYSLNAPEAFDKNLFKNTINALKESELIKVTDNSTFEVCEKSDGLLDWILNKIDPNSKQLMQRTTAWAHKYWEEG